MFEWWRRWRAGPQIPESLWQATLARYRFLEERSVGHQSRLRALAAELLRDKQFHGAHGFAITDEVALAIAAQAVLPVLHLPGGLDWYGDFVGIVVHSSEVLARRQVLDEAGVMHEYDEVVAGEAMEHGPVMLSWQDVLAGSVTQAAGYNVVIHEFAHKIDMRNGSADGCPPLPTGFAGTDSTSAGRSEWLAVLLPAFEDFCERSARAERFGGETPWLDDYAAQSTTEFFAVACEGYFVQRERFGLEFPTLLALFDQFYLPNRAAAHG